MFLACLEYESCNTRCNDSSLTNLIENFHMTNDDNGREKKLKTTSIIQSLSDADIRNLYADSLC